MQTLFPCGNKDKARQICNTVLAPTSENVDGVLTELEGYMEANVDAGVAEQESVYNNSRAVSGVTFVLVLVFFVVAVIGSVRTRCKSSQECDDTAE